MGLNGKLDVPREVMRAQTRQHHRPSPPPGPIKNAPQGMTVGKQERATNVHVLGVRFCTHRGPGANLLQAHVPMDDAGDTDTVCGTCDVSV
jgi:hypothetical protein